MQEDVEGTMRSLLHERHAAEGLEEACSLCGRVYPAGTLSRLPGEQDEGVRSEYEDVCPECGRILTLGGEPGFPLDER